MQFRSIILVSLLGSASTLPVEVNPIERVIVIGLDGAGSFHKTVNPPTISNFFKSAAYCNLAGTQFPTSSGQNWGSIITGITAKKHGINNDNISSKPYPDISASPTTFKSVLQKYPDGLVASYSSWSPINKGLIEASISSKVVQVSDKDDALTNKIVQFLNGSNKSIKYLFIQLSDIDYAGHNFGWNTKQYKDQYLKTDSNVKKILQAITDNQLDSTSLIVITADHGGLGKNHGGSSTAESTVLFAVKGPTVKPQLLPDYKVSNIDTAAIVLHALDIELPKNYDAKVPDIFE